MQRQYSINNPVTQILLCLTLLVIGGNVFASDPNGNICLDSKTSLWISEGSKKTKLLQFYGDGQYAAFSPASALEERTKPRVACALSEDGYLRLPTVHRKRSWELLDSGILEGFSMQPLYKDNQRVEGEFERKVSSMHFRLLTDKERMDYWRTSAHRFVRHGLLDEIKQAQAGGLDFSKIIINGPSDTQVAYADYLADAIKYRQKAVFEHFLAQGYDLAASDAMLEAIKLRDVSLAAYVLDHGFPVQASLRNVRNSPNDDIAVLLLERGYVFETPVPFGPKSGSILVERDTYNKDPGFLASVSSAGRTDLIKKILNDIPSLANNQQRLFANGIMPAVSAGQLESLQTLLAAGASLDGRFGSKNLLSLAVESGSIEMIRFILANGFDVNQRDRAKTPLDVAILADAKPAVFELLFAAGAKPEAKHPRVIKISMKQNKDAVLVLFKQQPSQVITVSQTPRITTGPSKPDSTKKPAKQLSASTTMNPAESKPLPKQIAQAPTTQLAHPVWEVVGFWDYDAVDAQQIQHGLQLKQKSGSRGPYAWTQQLELISHNALPPRARQLWPVQINRTEKKVCINAPYPTFPANIDFPENRDNGIYTFASCKGGLE